MHININDLKEGWERIERESEEKGRGCGRERGMKEM